MPSLRLSNPFRRNAAKPTLRERAAALKASAARVMGKRLDATTAEALGSGTADAELLRLERKWNEARATEAASYARQAEIAVANPGPGEPPKGLEAWSEWQAAVAAWRAASGIEDEEQEGTALSCLVDDISEEIAATPASTLAGLQVKARVILHFADVAVDPVEGLTQGLCHALLAMKDPASKRNDAPTPGAMQIERLTARWRETAAAADAATEDAEISRRVVAMNAAEEAVIDAPIACARDLACKVEVLRYAMRHHSLDAGRPAVALSMICNGVEALADAEDGQARTDLAAARLDLSGCSNAEVCRLYEVLSQAAEHLDAAACLPCFEGPERGAGSQVVNAEQSRMAHLRDACARELTLRTPKSAFERDDVLSVRIAHEIACNGRIEDQALLASAVQAWNA